MKIQVRLYRQHDMDLIDLYNHPNFSLQNAIKKALSAYVSDEIVAIELPTLDESSTRYQDKLQSKYAFKITIDDERVVQLMQNIKTGYRNNFIKNLIRGYMSMSLLYLYLKEPCSIATMNDMSKQYNENCKNSIPIKAGKKRKARLNKRTIEIPEGATLEEINNLLLQKNLLQKETNHLEMKEAKKILKEAKKETLVNVEEKPEEKPLNKEMAPSPNLEPSTPQEPNEIAKYKTNASNISHEPSSINENENDDFNVFESVENLMDAL